MSLVSGITALAAAIATAVNGKAPKHPTINSQTGTTYTLVLADDGNIVERSNASANTCTVPPNSSVPFPTGTTVLVRQTGAGKTTIAAGAGVTINSRGGVLGSGGQWAAMVLTKRGTNLWTLDGDIA